MNKYEKLRFFFSNNFEIRNNELYLNILSPNILFHFQSYFRKYQKIANFSFALKSFDPNFYNKNV